MPERKLGHRAAPPALGPGGRRDTISRLSGKYLEVLGGVPICYE